MTVKIKRNTKYVILQAPVVQRLDNAIHRINRMQRIIVYKTNHTMTGLDSDLSGG